MNEPGKQIAQARQWLARFQAALAGNQRSPAGQQEVYREYGEQAMQQVEALLAILEDAQAQAAVATVSLSAEPPL